MEINISCFRRIKSFDLNKNSVLDCIEVYYVDDEQYSNEIIFKSYVLEFELINIKILQAFILRLYDEMKHFWVNAKTFTLTTYMDDVVSVYPSAIFALPVVLVKTSLATRYLGPKERQE